MTRNLIDIVHTFNMANDSASIIEGIRALPEKERNNYGIGEVDLIINRKDFAMAFPQWEFNDIQGVDPYHASWEDICKRFPPPPWVKTWEVSSLIDPVSVFKLYKLCEPYQIRQMHPPSSIYLQFHKPFNHHIDIIHEAGWGRNITGRTKFGSGDGLSPQEKLGRLAYKKAPCILMTNPDMYSFMGPLLFDKNGHRKDVFIPFAINMDRYRPMKVDRGPIDDDTLIIFHPARMTFKVKGNDELIKAFIGFHKLGYKAVLKTADWGFSEDALMAQSMLQKADLMKYVQVAQPMSKYELVKNYNWADVVADQFKIGSFGTLGPEAMSCGKPVLGYLNDWNIGGWIHYGKALHYIQTFGEMQPVANCQYRGSSPTPLDIYAEMSLLTDPHYRRYIGERARRYVERYYESKVVGRQHLILYNKLLHGVPFQDVSS